MCSYISHIFYTVISSVTSSYHIDHIMSTIFVLLCSFNYNKLFSALQTCSFMLFQEIFSAHLLKGHKKKRESMIPALVFSVSQR